MHGKKWIFLSSHGKMRLRFLKFSPLAPPTFFSHFYFYQNKKFFVYFLIDLHMYNDENRSIVARRI